MPPNCRRTSVGPILAMGSVLFTILFVTGLSGTISAQEPIDFTLETSKDKYVMGELVVLKATLRGIEPNGTVTFEVDDHNSLPVLILTAPLAPNGTAETSFRLNKEDFPIGRYEVHAVVKFEDGQLKSSRSISVLKDTGKKEGRPFDLVLVAGALSTIVAVTSVGAFIAGTEVGKYGLFKFFAISLYSRLRPEEVRDQETRGKILGYITATPGAHYNEIKKELELKNGNASYHLGRLEQEGLVESSRQGIYKVFYLTKVEKIPRVKKVGRIQKEIYELVGQNPGITQKRICNELELKQSTVSYNLNKMIRSDRMETKKVKGVTRYYLTYDLSEQEEELTNERRIQLLEDRFLKGEISEKTYNRLVKKFEKGD